MYQPRPALFAFIVLFICVISGCKKDPDQAFLEAVAKKGNRSTEIVLDAEKLKAEDQKRLRSIEVPSWEMIGTRAPKIDVQHWITDREGALPHVSEFEPEEVYLLTFWSVGNMPSVQSLQFLGEMQGFWVDHGVQMIAVTDDSLETVEAFLKEGTPGNTQMEIAKKMSLVADPDHSTSESFLKAAGLTKVPFTFLIGKTGLIEWIGNPNELIDILKDVKGDRWNRTRFASRLLQRQVTHAADVGDMEKAMKLYEPLLAQASDQDKYGIQTARWNDLQRNDHPAATEAFTKLIDEGIQSPRNFGTLFRRVITMVKQKKLKPEVASQLDQAIARAVQEISPDVETNGYDLKIEYLLIRDKVQEALELAKERVAVDKGKEGRAGRTARSIALIQRLDLTESLSALLKEFQAIALEDLEPALKATPDAGNLKSLKETIDKITEPRPASNAAI